MEGFTPNYLNIEYFFYKFYLAVQDFIAWIKGDHDLSWLYVILFIIGAIGLAVTIYTLVRIRQNDIKENQKQKECHDKCLNDKVVPNRNEKWDHVRGLADSNNSNDWRVAIIEADTILDEVITTLGVQGANLGERLQNMSPVTFPYLQTAWEAHKVRNRIAHEGTNFEITKRTVDVAIGQYEVALKSLGYIQ